MRPQQMGDVMSPGFPVLPVLCLQRDAVFGPGSLTDPNLELHPVLADALGQAHLARLRGGNVRTFKSQQKETKCGEILKRKRKRNYDKM